MREIGEGSFVIIEESPQDTAGIRAVNIAAFGREDEADVVDQLRKTSPTFFSIIAKADGKVIGHVLFTPVYLIQNDDWSIEGMGLAPLAVLPAYQNQGVGSSLCIEGLRHVETVGYPFVVVLGDPSYYQRFGFEQASDFGIKSAFIGIPEEAFMLKVLKPKIMAGTTGVVYYRQEFNDVT